MDVNKLSAKFMSEFVNKLNRASDYHFFNEKEALIYQVVLLHLYTDFILTQICEKKGLKFDWRFTSKLNALTNAKTLDDDGYKALKILNDLRNELAHDFEIDIETVKLKIDNFKNLKIIGNKDFFERLGSTIEKLEVICIHYINSLREEILRLTGGVIDNLPFKFKMVDGKELYLSFGDDEIKEQALDMYKGIKKELEERFGKS